MSKMINNGKTCSNCFHSEETGRCMCPGDKMIGVLVYGYLVPRDGDDSFAIFTCASGYCKNWKSTVTKPEEILCNTCKSMCKQNVTDCLRYRADKICSHCDCIWWKKDKCAAPAKTPLAFPSSDCGKWQLKQEILCDTCKRKDCLTINATKCEHYMSPKQEEDRKQLTIPATDSKLLCRHDRTTIRESLAKIMLSLTEYYTEPPCLECKRNLHDDLLGEIGKIQELL